MYFVRFGKREENERRAKEKYISPPSKYTTLMSQYEALLPSTCVCVT